MSDDIYDLIDQRLNENRPDRYAPGDDQWMEAIFTEVAPHIDAFDAQRQRARDIVMRREVEATKRTNRVLREIHKSGQLPLDWLDICRWPLSVGEARVALGACTDEDLTQFATIERRRAANDFGARNDTCSGAEDLAGMIRANRKVKVARDLGLVAAS